MTLWGESSYRHLEERDEEEEEEEGGRRRGRG